MAWSSYGVQQNPLHGFTCVSAAILLCRVRIPCTMSLADPRVLHIGLVTAQEDSQLRRKCESGTA
jgi:hypothetical protein